MSRRNVLVSMTVLGAACARAGTVPETPGPVAPADGEPTLARLAGSRHFDLGAALLYALRQPIKRDLIIAIRRDAGTPGRGGAGSTSAPRIRLGIAVAPGGSPATLVGVPFLAVVHPYVFLVEACLVHQHLAG